jgi:spermidine synthase
MPYATYVAVVLNVIVASLAILIAGRTPSVVLTDTEARPAPQKAEMATMVYVAIGLSGLTALGAEVLWTRVLSLLFGATAYTFSLILAIYLIGLGIGSSLGAAIARNVARPRIALG